MDRQVSNFKVPGWVKSSEKPLPGHLKQTAWRPKIAIKELVYRHESHQQT